MKRRAFIFSTSIVAVGLPIAYYAKLYRQQKKSLYHPIILSQFCDDVVLDAIGKNYLQLTPAEKDAKKLTSLILLNEEGRQENKHDLKQFIDKKIKQDFVKNNTIAINGWFISVTEARQCALLSLNLNKI